MTLQERESASEVAVHFATSAAISEASAESHWQRSCIHWTFLTIVAQFESSHKPIKPLIEPWSRNWLSLISKLVSLVSSSELIRMWLAKWECACWKDACRPWNFWIACTTGLFSGSLQLDVITYWYWVKMQNCLCWIWAAAKISQIRQSVGSSGGSNSSWVGSKRHPSWCAIAWAPSMPHSKPNCLLNSRWSWFHFWTHATAKSLIDTISASSKFRLLTNSCAVLIRSSQSRPCGGGAPSRAARSSAWISGKLRPMALSIFVACECLRHCKLRNDRAFDLFIAEVFCVQSADTNCVVQGCHL